MVVSVVRNAPQPLPVSFADRDGGAFFYACNCLHCTSMDRIKQVISVLSTAQELRSCKQKEALCFQRLRDLERMFMSIIHSL